MGDGLEKAIEALRDTLSRIPDVTASAIVNALDRRDRRGEVEKLGLPAPADGPISSVPTADGMMRSLYPSMQKFFRQAERAGRSAGPIGSTFGGFGAGVPVGPGGAAFRPGDVAAARQKFLDSKAARSTTWGDPFGKQELRDAVGKARKEYVKQQTAVGAAHPVFGGWTGTSIGTGGANAPGGAGLPGWIAGRSYNAAGGSAGGSGGSGGSGPPAAGAAGPGNNNWRNNWRARAHAYKGGTGRRFSSKRFRAHAGRFGRKAGAWAGAGAAWAGQRASNWSKARAARSAANSATATAAGSVGPAGKGNKGVEEKTDRRSFVDSTNRLSLILGAFVKGALMPASMAHMGQRAGEDQFEANRRHGHYSHTVGAAYAGVAMGDIARARQLARANEDTAVVLARNVDQMRNSFQSANTFGDAARNRLGIAGSRGAAWANAIYEPFFKEMTGWLGRNDPQGQHTERAMDKFGKGAAYAQGYVGAILTGNWSNAGEIAKENQKDAERAFKNQNIPKVDAWRVALLNFGNVNGKPFIPPKRIRPVGPK